MPSFRSISGIRAGLRPAQRRLAHRPVAGKPLPVDPDHGVVLRQPLPPDLVEHARTDPLLQSAGAPRKRSRSRSRSTRSTASRPQHQQNRVHRSTVRHPRPMTTPTDATAQTATTDRSSPTTTPASANHHRSRPTPSKPSLVEVQPRGRTSLPPSGSLPSGTGPYDVS